MTKPSAWLAALLALWSTTAQTQGQDYIGMVTNTPNLMAYWQFDPVFQTNSCVNGYTGILHGNAQIGPPGSGCLLAQDAPAQALLLDGVSSFLTTSLIGQITNQGTVLAWVYLTAQPAAAGQIFQITSQAEAGDDFDLQIQTDNRTYFYTDTGTATVYPRPLPTNQWQFLAVTFIANSNRCIYLNGQLVASSTAGAHSANNTALWIGNNPVYSPRLFQGRLDEVAIFSRALASSEIEALYSAAGGVPAQSTSEYTGDHQTNTISGFAADWGSSGSLDDYFVGENWADDALVIENGGSLLNGGGHLGFSSGANSNSVLVTDSGSAWINSGDLDVGDVGSANSLTISNGGAVYDDYGNIGFDVSSSNNAVLVTGPGSVWSNGDDLQIGLNGSANTLVIANGGGVFNGYGNLAFSAGSSGNMVVITDPGSLWSCRDEMNVGATGAGNTLTITNSGVVNDLWSALGLGSASSNNTALVTGPGSVWNTTNTLWVGYGAPGNQLTVTNGGLVLVGAVSIGAFPGGVGTLTLAGGTITSASWFSLGTYGGSGTFYMTGGQVNAPSNNLAIGERPGASGQMIMSGGSVQVEQFHIAGNEGPDATGTLTVSGGTINSGDFMVGMSAGSTGTVLMTGGAVTVATLLSIGHDPAAMGSVSITGGQLVATNIGIALGDTGPGQMTVSDGSVTTSVMNIGVWPGGADGLLTVAGGTVSVLTRLIIGGNEGSATGAVLVSGGELVAPNTETDVGYLGTGNLTVSGGTAWLGHVRVGLLDGSSGSITLAGGTLAVNQLVLTSGSNSVFTFEAGTLDSGGTLVTTPQNFTVGDGTDAATFHLSGGGHSFVNGALEIQNNALLDGCGSIYGTLQVDAGGLVMADCGGTLNVLGSVVNNGIITATNGTVINFFGPVINNGQIGPASNVHYYSVPASVGTTNCWISSASDKWEGGFDWSAGAPSIIQPAVFISNPGTKTVTMDLATALTLPSALNISNLTISGSSGSTNTLLLSAMGGSVPLQIGNNLTVQTGGIVSESGSALEIDGSGAVVGTPGLFIGVNSAGEQLNIQGGQVSDDTASLGYYASSSNNAVLVTDRGSAWINTGNLDVGDVGLANSLTISNSGAVYNGYGNIGFDPASSSNTVLVTGPGSVWSNGNDLQIGLNGSANTLVIANGGAVFNGYGNLAFSSGSSSNVVVVTDPGSLWNCRDEMNVGATGAGNTLTITNGGVVNDLWGALGLGSASSNNTVLVTGPGSVWNTTNTLWVGYGAPGNQLTVSDGGSVRVGTLLSIGHNPAAMGSVCITGGQLVATNAGIAVGDTGPGQMTVNNGSVTTSVMNVGVWPGGADGLLTVAGGTVSVLTHLIIGGNEGNATGAVLVSGGELVAPNIETDVGYLGTGNLTVSGGTAWLGNVCVGLLNGSSGSVTVAGGTVSVNRLVLTNGSNSVFAFEAGTLDSGGTCVSNHQTFVVGDGTDAATFQLSGGVHSFANNLEISSNAVLSGCGTISGNVIIDPGGTVLANCRGTLIFTGNVTNLGTLQAVGTLLEVVGATVNSGLINATSGGTEFLGGLVNYGTVLSPSAPPLTSMLYGTNIILTWPAYANGFSLQSSRTLYPPLWTDVSPSSIVLDAQNTVTNVICGSQMFFRLRPVLPGLAWIPEGTFTMGDTLDGESDAVPTNTTVSAFYMDTNLVSFDQWEAVYNYATHRGYGFFNDGAGLGTNYPVESVDWFDCVKWSNARSQQAGLTPVYYTDAGFTQVFINGDTGATVYANWSANGYRLPTEAEWETAARGGLSGQRFPWGDTISWNQANYYGSPRASGGYAYDLATGDGYDPVFSGGGDGIYPCTSPVGYFASNGYGLNDTAGNVYEWCWDCYGTPYAGGSDPRGPTSGFYRVLRGGSWNGDASDARCANRSSIWAGFASGSIGFRCVRRP